MGGGARGALVVLVALVAVGGVLADRLGWRSEKAGTAAPPTVAGTARVARVLDGDSVRVDWDGRTVEIRLAEIDAPEWKQPHGERAKRALRELLPEGATVGIETLDVDDYGRTVARVEAGGRSVNAELVRRGHAWVSRRWARDRSLYDLEDEARRAKRGLWRLPADERVPPWEWRRANRRR